MNQQTHAWFSGWPVTRKGGSGSGNWGHAGRKGKKGGSLPGGPGIVTNIMQGGDLDRDDIEKLRTEIQDTWEGSRQDYALGSFGSFYQKGHEVVLGHKDGELVGIASLHPPEPSDYLSDNIPSGNYVTLRTLATKRRGIGRNMMDQVKDAARSKGSGLFVIADPESVGFFQAMGMKHGEGQEYYFTPEDIKG